MRARTGWLDETAGRAERIANMCRDRAPTFVGPTTFRGGDWPAAPPGAHPTARPELTPGKGRPLLKCDSSAGRAQRQRPPRESRSSKPLLCPSPPLLLPPPPPPLLPLLSELLAAASAQHGTAQKPSSVREKAMEVEAMLEDDVFFAELSKRISLLITDDDEGADFAAAAQFIPAAAPLPGFASLGGHVPPRQQQQGGGASLLAPPPYTLYHHLHHHGASYGGDSAALAAAWQQQRGSKGTGVFIPRSTPGAAHTRKKGKNRGAAAARAARAGANALVAGGPAKKRA